MDQYNRLRERLDTHPAGAPPSAYMDQILRILFSPEEAQAACYLTFVLQPVSQLAEKAGMDAERLQAMYEDMANRGLVMAKLGKNGEHRYSMLPTIPGLFEFPFMRPERTPQREELARLWHAYHTEALGNAFAGSATPQMRVIPVRASLPLTSEVLIYEQVAEMISRAKDIAVTNCACRVSMGACGKPLEVCLAFNMGARFLVERDLGRMIDQEEALRILDFSEASGLVHTINNSQDRPAVICNCCGCCCTLLRGITELANPNAIATSSYMVNFKEEDCTGCFSCLEDRCPVAAVRENGDVITVEAARCIGCGLCASVCPTEALSMKKRDVIPDTPKTGEELAMTVLKEKGKLEAFMQLNMG